MAEPKTKLTVSLTYAQLRGLAALNPMCKCGEPLVYKHEVGPAPAGHLACISGTLVKRGEGARALAIICDAAHERAEDEGDRLCRAQRKDEELRRRYAELMAQKGASHD